jgi:hypothetical protein
VIVGNSEKAFVKALLVPKDLECVLPGFQEAIVSHIAANRDDFLAFRSREETGCLCENTGTGTRYGSVQPQRGSRHFDNTITIQRQSEVRNVWTNDRWYARLLFDIQAPDQHGGVSGAIYDLAFQEQESSGIGEG